jgi:sporulation protein YlmC with PRC-barrel domain
MLVRKMARVLPLMALVACSGGVFAQSGDTNTFVAERRPDQWLASSLKAKNVYDRSDAKIGVINDLVIDRDGRVAAVVIGVGGFLGIGEKNVGVPFQDLKISMRDNNEWLVLERSRDDLRAAPAFGVATAPQPNKAENDRNYGTMNAPNRAQEAPR